MKPLTGRQKLPSAPRRRRSVGRPELHPRPPPIRSAYAEVRRSYGARGRAGCDPLRVGGGRSLHSRLGWGTATSAPRTRKSAVQVDRDPGSLQVCSVYAEVRQLSASPRRRSSGPLCIRGGPPFGARDLALIAGSAPRTRRSAEEVAGEVAVAAVRSAYAEVGRRPASPRPTRPCPLRVRGGWSGRSSRNRGTPAFAPRRRRSAGSVRLGSAIEVVRST